MSLLEDLGTSLDRLKIVFGVGEYPEKPPDTFVVLIPILDEFPVMGDGIPLDDLQHVRISIFCQGDYKPEAKRVTRVVTAADMCVTGRGYAGFERDTGYHNYVIDVAKYYSMED